MKTLGPGEISYCWNCALSHKPFLVISALRVEPRKGALMTVNESGLPRKKLAAYVACLIHSGLNQLELRFRLSMI